MDEHYVQYPFIQHMLAIGSVIYIECKSHAIL